MLVRRLLQRCDLLDAQRFKGQQVELFWPEDATWWLARIIKVSHLLPPPQLGPVVPAWCFSGWHACFLQPTPAFLARLHGWMTKFTNGGACAAASGKCLLTRYTVASEGSLLCVCS